MHLGNEKEGPLSPQFC